MKKNRFLTRLMNWEHWPTFMFYTPLVPFFIIRTIKAKNPLYFLVANPSILYSGIGSESKFKTIQLVPRKHQPESILIAENTNFNVLLDRLKNTDLNYPLIVKPDIGFRGYLVKKINNEENLKNYFSKINIPVIIQEFIDYKNEIGVFYHRIPGDKKGKITSVTIKKYPTVTGNGKNTLSELILDDEKVFLYYDLLKNIHKEKMEEIVVKDKTITLSEIGNHSKGTQFINGNHLINSDLENIFDALDHQIDGWFYGRIDLKYETFDQLCKGEYFKVVEINGIMSEPTHIYDASTGATYLEAVRTIKYNWKILDKIALKNHREYGVEYPNLLPFVKNMSALSKHAKVLKRLNRVC